MYWLDIMLHRRFFAEKHLVTLVPSPFFPKRNFCSDIEYLYHFRVQNELKYLRDIQFVFVAELHSDG
jgi:hypothetical protein